MKWLAAFGRFWYDFLVGDSVILAIGVVVILVGSALLVQAGGAVPAQVLLPAAIGVTLAISVRQTR